MDTIALTRLPEDELQEIARRRGASVALVLRPEEEGYARLLRWLADTPPGGEVLLDGLDSLGTNPQEYPLRLLYVEALGGHPILLHGHEHDSLEEALDAFRGGTAQRVHRIRETLKSKAVRGLGQGKPPYGYRAGPDGQLREVGEEAPLVRLMFERSLQKQGIRTIVKELNGAGHHTRRGGPWSMVTVRDILRNRTYTGRYARWGVIVPRNHPAIVSAETFRRVQERLNTQALHAGHGRGSPYLLSGIAVCGACGSRMIGVTRRQTWRRKDGTVQHQSYRYYQCGAATNQGRCSYHTRQAEELEESVLRRVKGIVDLSPEAIPPLLPPQETPNAARVRSLVRQAAEKMLSLRELRLRAYPLLAPARDKREAEQRRALRRLLQSCVERVVVREGHVEVRLRRGTKP
ncbi:MAG: recombinase family protein [Chloroflexi bacterium]|nr:recombinase family protein [Chloroflexota bacterium]